MKQESTFKVDKAEAISLAKEQGASVIFSIAPREKNVKTAKRWGYYVEKEPGMIRNWEKIVYSPS